MLLALDPRLARRIGALTLFAMAAIAAAFVFLYDRAALGSPVRFRVVFRHAAGLRERAPLVVAGRPVGRIAAITPVLHGAPGALAGEVGIAALVEVAGDEAWKVPAAGTIFVASRGALSERYLEIAPPPGAPGPPVRDGAELRGVDPPTLDNVLQHTWNNLTTFQQFVDTVRPELTALRDQLRALRGHLDELGGAGDLADATAGLVAAARQTYGTGLGGSAGIDHLVAITAEARGTIGEIRALLDSIGPDLAATAAQLARIRGHVAAGDPLGRAEQLLATARAAADRIDPLLAAARAVIDRLARGEGSLGRLMNDPEFPEDTKELGKIIKRSPWKVLEKPADYTGTR